MLSNARAQIDRWEFAGDDDQMLAWGLRRTYGRARSAMAAAEAREYSYMLPQGPRSTTIARASSEPARARKLAQVRPCASAPSVCAPGSDAGSDASAGAAPPGPAPATADCRRR